jgi:hypothetical protein
VHHQRSRIEGYQTCSRNALLTTEVADTADYRSDLNDIDRPSEQSLGSRGIWWTGFQDELSLNTAYPRPVIALPRPRRQIGTWSIPCWPLLETEGYNAKGIYSARTVT